LLCSNYPISNGEFFIDDEIRVIAKRFEKVYVLVNAIPNGNTKRYMPENMVVHAFTETISLLERLKALPYIFFSFFREEWKLAPQKYAVKPSLLLFKLMFIDLVRALKTRKQILNVLTKENLNSSDIIFYSYWHDYKALALALMKAKDTHLICVARAHGWDVFYERHQPPYLPFKKFIVSNLDVTYSISDAGRYALLHLLGNEFNHKISVSRLGKINHHLPLTEKKYHEILICSCSNIVPVKRVHLIVELLNELCFKNLRWVHFGDGFLRPEIEQLAEEKLLHIEFEFRGNVTNAEILDFYHENYVDLFINVSESEGIPVSIMEALSAGIPVLATDVGGTSEVVNEEVGFLIPKNFEIHEVVNIISNYLNLPEIDKKLYRANAYRFWKENYEAYQNYGDFVENLFKLCDRRNHIGI
jgi:glycosyltransferase involved in cell wall biosynthesis